MNDKKNAKPKKKNTFFSNTIVHNQNWKKNLIQLIRNFHVTTRTINFPDKVVD